MGLSLLSQREDFTTENTEDHGGPRRFFGLTMCAYFQARIGARSVPRLMSPWSSVVLGVLRGKIFLSPRQIPTPDTPR
jgi:hypothetical protein